MTVQSASATGPAAGEPGPISNPFATVGFRVWWAASVVAGLGVGIQTVTVPLFIRDRVSEDNRAIAIAAALISTQILAAAFSLLGGVLADRVERRRILVRTYSVAAIVSVAYVVLSAMDVSVVWPVYPLAMVVGTAGAFTNPARQSMVPQLLSRAQLQNGIILGNVAFMALLQFGGPTIGGLLADTAGLTVAFGVEVAALAFAVVLFSRVKTDTPVPSGRNVRGDLADGLRFVAKTPSLIGLLSIGAIPGIFIMGPFAVTVVLLVSDVFEARDTFVGVLWGCFGGGILLGSLALTVKRLPRRGLFVCLCVFVGGFFFIGYGLTSSLPLAMVFLVLLGMTGPAVFINTVVALIQEYTPPQMMGRVMSMYGLTFMATSPIGYAQAAVVERFVGPANTVVISGLMCTSLGLLCVLFLKPVRRLD
ncbi:MAG: MFS transporter [Dehalococcoidia bacterium]